MGVGRLLALMICVALLPAALTAQVTITHLRDGAAREVAGTLVAESLDQVRFEVGGRERSVPTREVLSVSYGKGSAAYEQAQALIERGDVTGALAQFAAAAGDSEPVWVASQALLSQARTSARLGDRGLGDARAAIGGFLSRFPEHRLVPEAHVLAIGFASSPAEAQASADAVVALADAGRVTPDWRAEALLALGELQLENDDLRGAKETFAAAERAATAGARELSGRQDLVPLLAQQALRARVGSGSCLLAEGDITGARGFYGQLLRDGAGDDVVSAAAGNGLAECDFLEGGKLKQAQLGFARVSLISAGQPEEHARSLYYLGRCYAALADDGSEPNGRAAANAYLQEVQDRYPNTRWARLARENP